MNQIFQLYRQLNQETSDTSRWELVNRHLWRVAAMYRGGDVELASFPGSFAGQRLWNYRQPDPSESQEFVMSEETSPYTGCAKLARRFEAVVRRSIIQQYHGAHQ